MTISELPAKLRELSKQLKERMILPPGSKIARPIYDPACDYIALLKPNGIVEFGGMNLFAFLHQVLMDALNGGAFEPPHLAPFTRALSPERESADAVTAVLTELKIQGFNCWGLDPERDALGRPKRGALERVADAFEKIAQAKPADAKAPAKRKPLVGLQENIWAILETHTTKYDKHGLPKKCLTGGEIAEHLAKQGYNNQTEKTVGDAIGAMRDKGWPIENQRGAGYWIPKQSE